MTERLGLSHRKLDKVDKRLTSVFGEEHAMSMRNWLDEGKLDDRFSAEDAEMIRQIAKGEHPLVNDSFLLSSKIRARWVD